eukprot:TRINITY_DN2349_c0_g2_i1.p1 TRINITY_DN2349_c0_g2~~TRINITY_DN2349_c0_g2_i1.p1  ORF type:complete len:258 (-),score=66.91 TRINITY_DN2349_c0_g2_i1:135-908(-)
MADRLMALMDQTTLRESQEHVRIDSDGDVHVDEFCKQMVEYHARHPTEASAFLLSIEHEAPLTRRQENDLCAIFRSLDYDGNNKLSRNELFRLDAQGKRGYGYTLMDRLKKDGKRDIDLDGWLDHFKHQRNDEVGGHQSLEECIARYKRRSRMNMEEEREVEVLFEACLPEEDETDMVPVGTIEKLDSGGRIVTPAMDDFKLADLKVVLEDLKQTQGEEVFHSRLRAMIQALPEKRVADARKVVASRYSRGCGCVLA